MKVMILAMIAVAAGVTVGLGATWVEHLTVPELLRKDSVAQPAEGLAAIDESSTNRPKVLIENAKFLPELAAAVHNFGTMQLGESQEHTFVFRNEGDQPLEIRLLDTTCTCTTPSLEEGKVVSISPGGSQEVTLEWTPKKNTTSFNQAAEIGTNDPAFRSVDLVIEGKVLELVRADPASIIFNEIPTDQSRTIPVRILAYENDDLQYLRHQYSSAEAALHFEIDVEPLPKNAKLHESGAASGLLVNVRLQPGLPIGPFRQTVRIFTSEKPDVGIPIAIEGSIVGKITVRAAREKFNRSRQLLTLGVIPGGQQRTAELQVFVTGPRSADQELSLEQVEPSDVLRATLGQPTVNSDALRIYPLTIEIPADARPVTMLGPTPDKLGRIRIKTSDPDLQWINIFVSFGIEI